MKIVNTKLHVLGVELPDNKWYILHPDGRAEIIDEAELNRRYQQESRT